MAQLNDAELANLLRISEEKVVEMRAESKRRHGERDALLELAAELGIEHGRISAESDWITMPKATYRAVLERLREAEQRTAEQPHDDLADGGSS